MLCIAGCISGVMQKDAQVGQQVIYLPIAYAGNGSKLGYGAEYEGAIGQYADYVNKRALIKASIHWTLIEIQPHMYDFSLVDKKWLGYNVDYIVIKTTPKFYLLPGQPVCKLPLQQHWDKAAKFVQLVIDRYGPTYVGIWNEPDIGFSQMPANHAMHYGCVGNGTLYGQFVKYVYDHVDNKGTTLINIGEISNIYSFGNNFVANMLNANKDSYDGLSLHCYAYFYDFIYNDCLDNYIYAKTLTSKPVIISETAVYYRDGTQAAYHKAQQDHFGRMCNLPTTWFWYTGGYNNWPDPYSTDLLNKDLSPRPVWYTYIQGCN